MHVGQSISQFSLYVKYRVLSSRYEKIFRFMFYSLCDTCTYSITQIFMRMGLPKVITTDNGTEFKNDLNKHLMELLGIEQRFTTAYHPQV